MLATTAGQFLINEALPEELRDYNRTLDKKGISSLFQKLAEQHPDKYRPVAKKLMDIARASAYETGGYSFDLKHMQKAKGAKKITDLIRQQVALINANKDLSQDQKEQKILEVTMEASDRLSKVTYDESLAEGNPLAMQVKSGARGNPTNLRTLRGGDLTYVDHHEKPIPIPILRSYSEGLTPEEYFAGAFGARKGVMDVKFATQDAGYFCLYGETKVRMGDFSVKCIKDIAVDDVVMGADINGNTFPVRVSAVFANGKKELHRFSFRYGRSRSKFIDIVATKEHKALVHHIYRSRRRPDPKLHKTVTVGKQPLGDCQRSSHSFYSLVPAQGFDNAIGIHAPWAWFVGLLIGDGGLTTNHIGFSCADECLLKKLRTNLSAFNFRINKKGSSKYEYIIADSKPVGCTNRLRTYLKEIGLLGHKSPYKFIPAVVRSWDNNSVAALIRGVFDTDGSVAASNNDNMPSLKLSMTAEAVVKGVQELLAQRFGIYGQVARARIKGRPVKITPGSVSNHDLFTLNIADRGSIARFVAGVGLTDGPKKDKLLRLLGQDSPTITREDEFLFHFVSSAPVGEGETFDIEVDHPDHLFVLDNGAIVSNSKQLNQATHRLMVSATDADTETDDIRGLPVDTSDDDNEGSLLAHAAGGYPRNTVLTPKVLNDLRNKNIDKLLVRSPLVGGPQDGGVYARDVGVRERGFLAPIGDMVGVTAAQSLSEPLSQSQLSSKHSGGIAGAAKGIGGFKLLDQLVQVPKTFRGGASHAQVDGRVDSITEAPAGGYHLVVGGQKHYVPAGVPLKVQKGDEIEAGDVLSEGIPNPSEIVKHKGIGEGRRYYTNIFRNAMKDSGIGANRRNVELLARGLINHVRLTEEMDDFVPGDVIPYNRLEHEYKPREGHRILDPRQAVGHYLERPVLHYSIGTKVRPSMLSEFQRYNVGNLTVHPDAAPFEPEMVRGMQNVGQDPDWMTRMLGSNQQRGLLSSVHRGNKSDEQSTSFVPAMARAKDFGITSKVMDWHRTPKELFSD